MNDIFTNNEQLALYNLLQINKDYEKYRYFIKGDISGIQEFIFNVKSEKAAKTLKARSFYIQALSKICIYQLKQSLLDIEVFYDGGGNFYLFSNENPHNAIDGLQKLIDRDCQKEAFYVVLSYIDVENLKGEKYWEAINEKSNIDKLKKFATSAYAFQSYFTIGEKNKWASFTSSLNRSIGFEKIVKDERQRKDREAVESKKFSIFDSIFKLTSQKTNILENFENQIINKTPFWREKLWLDETLKGLRIEENGKREKVAMSEGEKHKDIAKGDIIDFHFLAKFAKLRTGTEKLGILKLDVDNLGKLFRGVSDLNELKKLSLAMEWFFDEFLLKLWETPFDDNEGNTHSFSDNVYVVFSGGDDCFFVGAWDAIFEFSHVLQQNFEAFSKFLKEQVLAINDKPLTISAGMMVVDAKFPVIRFAQMAEEALDAAKHQKESNGEKKKNKINIFSESMEWEGFRKAKHLQSILYDLIANKGESRALLDRLKRGALGYTKNLENAKNGRVNAPKVWKLFYFLRNIKNEDNKQVLEREIIRPYSCSLIQAFNKNAEDEIIHPSTFPVAARWAELMTKKKNN